MNALDLMARLGGEILNNKIRAMIDGEIVILARLEDQDWVYTDRGQALANTHSNLAVDEAAVDEAAVDEAAVGEAATKPRKKAAATVELGDVAPEL